MNPGNQPETDTLLNIRREEGFAAPEVIGSNLNEVEINYLVKGLAGEGLSSEEAEDLLVGWENGTVVLPEIGNLVWLADVYEPALGEDQLKPLPDDGVKAIPSAYRLVRENLTKVLDNIEPIGTEANVLNKVIALRQEIIAGRYGLDPKMRTDLANLMVLQLIVHPENTMSCVESILLTENPSKSEVTKIQKILPYLDIDIGEVNPEDAPAFVTAFKTALGGRNLEQIFRELYLSLDLKIEIPDTTEGRSMLEAMETLNELMASDEEGLYIYNPNHSGNYNYEFVRYEILANESFEDEKVVDANDEIATKPVGKTAEQPAPTALNPENNPAETEPQIMSREMFRAEVNKLITDYTKANIGKMKSRFDFFIDDLMVHLYLNLVHKANPKIKVESYGLANGNDNIKSISDIFNCLQMFSLQDGASTTPETFLMDTLLEATVDQDPPMGIEDLFVHLQGHKKDDIEKKYPGLLQDTKRGMFVLEKLINFANSESNEHRAYYKKKEEEIKTYNEQGKQNKDKSTPRKSKYYFFSQQPFSHRLEMANKKLGEKAAKGVKIGAGAAGKTGAFALGAALSPLKLLGGDGQLFGDLWSFINS